MRFCVGTIDFDVTSSDKGANREVDFDFTDSVVGKE